MPELPVEHAFERFSRLAARFGFEASAAPPGTVDGGRMAVTANGGELRLEWKPEDDRLRLQITHGPPEQEPAGWLELFVATCPGGILPEPEERGLLIALEYGLELMGPAAAAPEQERSAPG